MDSSQPLALTLTIRNADKLDNGAPLRLVVDRRNASIGRGPSNDWTLPDPERHISSRHCEVQYANGAYELIDRSTNGTFLNSDGQRLSGAHRLSSGDVIRIGPFELVAALAPSPSSAPSAPEIAAAPPPPSPPPPPPPAPAAEPAADKGAESRREQMWTMFELSNSVDWARGGFGTPAPTPAADSVPAAEAQPESPPPAVAPDAPVAAGLAEPAEVAPAGPAAEQPAVEPSAAGLDQLLAGAAMERGQIRQDDAAALAQAGMLLRKMIAGLVVMLEARARAKSQMGAQGTGLEIEGNNPLKFARGPEQALQYMLNPQERGFMPAERAIEDAFRDLQAHQLATLRAMQGALRATLDRFSPKSIRSRADTRGLLARILPGSRDAALWKAYETEFSGVAFDSDEAFMDIFAKQFRQAYDEISRQG